MRHLLPPLLGTLGGDLVQDRDHPLARRFVLRHLPQVVRELLALGAQLAEGVEQGRLRVPGYAEPERGGIVVFRSVEDSTPNLNIVKRVIGAGGDTLRMVHDSMYRNGMRLDEPYALHLAGGGEVDPDFRLQQMRAWQLRYYIGRDSAHYHPTTHDWGPVVVTPGHFCVMGDNRDESYDSRFWGFLPRAHIVGKPLVIYLSIATDPLRIRWNRMLRQPR